LLSVAETEASGTQATNGTLWEPEKSKDGSVAVIVSGADKRIEILRGGILIGQGPVSFADPAASLPEALYVKLQPVPGKPSPDWSVVLVAGLQPASATQLLSKLQLPPAHRQWIKRARCSRHFAGYNAWSSVTRKSLGDKLRRGSRRATPSTPP